MAGFQDRLLISLARSQKIENNPMHSSPGLSNQDLTRPILRVPQNHLTRRAKQGHNAIIPKSIERAAPRRKPAGVTSNRLMLLGWARGITPRGRPPLGTKIRQRLEYSRHASRAGDRSRAFEGSYQCGRGRDARAGAKPPPCDGVIVLQENNRGSTVDTFREMIDAAGLKIVFTHGDRQQLTNERFLFHWNRGERLRCTRLSVPTLAMLDDAQ